MKYKFLIKPHPILIEVDSLPGSKDIAEERARQVFRYRYEHGEIPLYDADHSDVEVKS